MDHNETFATGMLHFKKGSIYDGRISINDYEMSDEELKHNLEVIIGEARGRGVPIPADPEVRVWKMDEAKLVDLSKACLQELNYRGKLDTVKQFFPKNEVIKVELDDHEMALAETGRKIPAIKAVKTRLNLSLRDAKEQVDAYVAAWEKAGSPRGGLPKFVPPTPQF